MEKAPMSPTSKRLLGLRDFEAVTAEVRLKLIGDGVRKTAWENIDTTTLPRGPKRKMKQGIVLEILKKRILSSDTLRNHPIVYIGSGTDVEYPLALGGRKIVMLDPIFTSEEAVQEVVTRIENLTTQQANSNKGGEITFSFDFGDGDEEVIVRISAKAYEPENAKDTLPNQVGAFILFASQGPKGSISIDENMKAKLTEGGVILHDADIVRFDDTGNEEIIKLGQRPS